MYFLGGGGQHIRTAGTSPMGIQIGEIMQVSLLHRLLDEHNKNSTGALGYPFFARVPNHRPQHSSARASNRSTFSISPSAIDYYARGAEGRGEQRRGLRTKALIWDLGIRLECLQRVL